MLKTREMAFARLYISKFSRGRMSPDSPYDPRLGRESGKLTSAPPKFRGPYAYGRSCLTSSVRDRIVRLFGLHQVM